MIQDTGYTLWLVPKDLELKKLLQEIILRLSQEHRSEPFSPHITLVSLPKASEGEALEITRAVLKIFEETPITFSSINSHHIYFQAFFLEVQDKEELKKLHRESCRLANIPHYDYHPHLSLIYDDLKKEEVEIMKQEILPELSSYNLFSKNFPFELELWKTEGYASEWVKVKYD